MREVHLKELLTLSRWDQITPAEQDEAAYAVASRLPESFHFDGLETHELGQQRHRLAFFLWKEMRFALIPGGPATPGYAPGSFIPTEAQQESWEETRREYFSEASRLRRQRGGPIYPTLESYLEPRLSPLRQITFRPFLLQVIAEAINVRYPDPHQPHTTLTKRFSHAQVQEYIAQDEHGFRLPTSDEWEYACTAGARTLWRWGNDIPMIYMPSRRDSEQAWDLNLRPNAFGLLIGDEPEHREFTAEEDVLRGGDGGTTNCVLPGRFVEWLTLASSYWVKLEPRHSRAFYSIHVRRAYPLFH